MCYNEKNKNYQKVEIKVKTCYNLIIYVEETVSHTSSKPNKKQEVIL